MMKNRLVAFTAAALFATSALAQTAPDPLTAMVSTWIDANATDMDPVIQAYGNQCMDPVMAALPDTAKQTILTAGNIDDGIAALQTADATTQTALMASLQPCIETMFVGQQIWAMVSADATLTVDQRTTKANCLMDAVKPLSTDAKQAIFSGADFNTGVQALVANQPALAGDVATQVAACG